MSDFRDHTCGECAWGYTHDRNIGSNPAGCLDGRFDSNGKRFEFVWAKFKSIGACPAFVPREAPPEKPEDWVKDWINKPKVPPADDPYKRIMGVESKPDAVQPELIEGKTRGEWVNTLRFLAETLRSQKWHEDNSRACSIGADVIEGKGAFADHIPDATKMVAAPCLDIRELRKENAELLEEVRALNPENERLLVENAKLRAACQAALDWIGPDGDHISDPARQQLVGALK